MSDYMGEPSEITQSVWETNKLLVWIWDKKNSSMFTQYSCVTLDSAYVCFTSGMTIWVLWSPVSKFLDHDSYVVAMASLAR